MTFQLPSKIAFLLLALFLGVYSPAYGESFGLPKNEAANWQSVEILPVDEAFSLQTIRTEGKIEVLWQIQPGHYLYRHKLGFDGSARLGKPQIPEGAPKADEYFGDVEVYYEALIVEVPVDGSAEEHIEVEYQGCSDAGICYPAQKRRFSL